MDARSGSANPSPVTDSIQEMTTAEITRSKFISLVATSVIIGLAGCSGDSASPENASDEDVEVDAAHEGDISTDGAVTVADDTNVEGAIDAGSHVDIGSNATINGSITAEEMVTIRDDTRIDGDVRGGNVDIAESATVTGEIQETG